MKKYFLALALFCLSGCSVYMAWQEKGVSVNDVRNCADRGCFMALGSQELESKTRRDGTTAVVYKVLRKNGDKGRSVGYAYKDLMTGGMSEVIFTPLEGYLSDNDSIIFKVIYNKADEAVKLIVQGD
jgi:hypothetical protein